VRVVVALGGFAYDVVTAWLPVRAGRFPCPTEVRSRGRRRRAITIVGCYHPSQQNTFTGRLTEPMLDTVFLRARALIDG
jgi:uracil-DNA glycosylase